MAKKFAVPNWSQSLIAQAVGLDPSNVSVEHEDDRNISFQVYQPHHTVLVGKVDGTVIKREVDYGNRKEMGKQ